MLGLEPPLQVVEPREDRDPVLLGGLDLLLRPLAPLPDRDEKDDVIPFQDRQVAIEPDTVRRGALVEARVRVRTDGSSKPGLPDTKRQPLRPTDAAT